MFENMTPEEIRTACEEIVKRPGKFEGESPYVPWFYDAWLNGGGEDWWEGEDWCEGEEIGDIEYTRFYITEEDVTIFPDLLYIGQHIDIRETSDGFVCEL